MRFRKKEKKILRGYLSAFALLLVCYLLVFTITQQKEQHSKIVYHTNEAISNLEQLASCMKDAETALRGYIIMKDSSFLQPYNNSRICVDTSFATLRKITASDPYQQKNLDTLAYQIEQKFRNITISIAEVKSNKFFIHDTLIKRSYYGRNTMENIRRIVNQMQDHENTMLLSRTKELNVSSEALKIINIATLIIAILLALYSITTYNSENKAKKLYRSQLEEGIEKLKKSNNELIELKSIEKFAATGRISRAIAHEVRNPLSSIVIAADNLGNNIQPSEETTLLIDMIKRNANRINQLISELLNSTKFAQLELVKIPVENILDQALELAGDRIELNGIHVIRNYWPQPCEVKVDAEKLKIAFLNIILNAIEAMEPNKGYLELKTEQRNNKCLISISDNGIGMSEEAMSRIFEPYFTQKEHGNGLGLTHTQNIILNHKGNISAESSIGKGTTFSITLGLANDLKKNPVHEISQ